MSKRKPYKHGKKGKQKFVMLSEWFQSCPAWANLPPGPRALYIELKRRFTGSNNGEIKLSHREAATRLNVHRNTVGPWFDCLEERGFIRKTQGHCLGPNGVGQTAHWALEEEASNDGKPAGKSFMKWRPEKYPRTKNMTPRHKKQDSRCKQHNPSAEPVLKIVTG